MIPGLSTRIRIVEPEIIRIEAELSGGKGFALLPTVGGQTALNLAVELSDGGALAGTWADTAAPASTNASAAA